MPNYNWSDYEEPGTEDSDRETDDVAEARQRLIKNLVLAIVIFLLAYSILYFAGVEYVATIAIIAALILVSGFVAWRCHVIANRAVYADDTFEAHRSENNSVSNNV